MEREHEQSGCPLSESNDQLACDWVTRGVSWLGKCGGLVAGQSAHAAEKAGSMFAAVGRVAVQALTRSGEARRVLSVRTSDLARTECTAAREPGLRERVRLLQKDVSRLLRKKEAEVLALLRRKDDARRGKGELGQVEDAIRQDEVEIARLSEELEAVCAQWEAQRVSKGATNKAESPAALATTQTVCTAEQLAAEGPLVRASIPENRNGDAALPAFEVPAEQLESAQETPSSQGEVWTAPIRESRGAEQAPSPRPKRLSMEEIARRSEFALAWERMTFIGVIRGLETGGRLTESAAKKLTAIANPAVDQLFALLAEHPDEATRARSLGALAERQAKEALPVFKEAATDGNARVRAAAMSGLYKLGGEKAIPYLTKALKDTDARVRHRAVMCLAWMGSQDVVPKLHELMKDDDASVRRAVVGALGTLKSKASFPGLIQALDDEDVKVREAAHRTLKELSGRRIAFNAKGTLEERDKVKARWRTWWKEQRSSAENL